MVDNLTILMTHALMGYALWRMVQSPALDQEGESPANARGNARTPPGSPDA